MAEAERPTELASNTAVALAGRIVATLALLVVALLFAQMLLADAAALPRAAGLGLCAFLTFAVAVTGLLCLGANRIHPASCAALGLVILAVRVAGSAATLDDPVAMVDSAMTLLAAYFLGSALAAWLSRTQWTRAVLATAAAALLVFHVLPQSARAVRAGAFAASTFSVVIPLEAREAWRFEPSGAPCPGLHLVDFALLAAVILLALHGTIGRKAVAAGVVVAAVAVGVLTAVSESPVPALPWVVATVLAARAFSPPAAAESREPAQAG